MSEYASYVRYLTLQGAVERYGITLSEECAALPHDHPRHILYQRIEHELDVITQAGFSSYFLIVADIMRFCREQDIPVGPGRGSVCGSAVAYCLYITDVEPIRFGIPFERFLHLERIAQPDIDIDLCQARRSEVIDYIKDKYKNVAQIATFGTMMARGVIKDVCRVLQMRHIGIEGDVLAAMIPEGSGADQVHLAEFIDTEEGKAFYDLTKDMQSPVDGTPLLQTCLQLEGVRRHGSSHSGGVVMADRPLSEIVPLWRRNQNSELHTHFDYKDAEDIGLLKIDLLGLRTVTVMGEAERLVRESDPEFVLKEIPLDDVATYELLSAGDTVGVFQLEGDGITNAVKGMRPDTFDDITVVLALYRPGPMEQLQTYIDRKHSKEEARYALPELEDILSNTYGLIVFQEQVMNMARVLAGYTPGEADLFRKAIGKKLPELIRTEIIKFTERALENGYNKKIIDLIGQQIAFFGRYGFNLGHATGYAFITYWTAYLKANHPTEFYTATLNSHVSDADRIGALLIDAKRHGVNVSCPDINDSGRFFSMTGPGQVRFGLEAVKGIGDKAVTDILEERDSETKNSISRERVQKTKPDGTKYMASKQVITRIPNEPRPYEDAYEFCTRLPSITIVVKRALVAAGAFMEDLEARAGLYALIEEINTAAKSKKPWRGYDGAPVAVPSTMEMIRAERDVLGFYVTKHPLEEYREAVERYGAIIDGNFTSLKVSCCVAGVLIEARTHQSKRGEMAWLYLESGITDLPKITVFSDQWKEIKHAEKGAVIIAWGKREQHPKFGWGLIASRVMVLDPNRPEVNDVFVMLPDTDMGDLAILAAAVDKRGQQVYIAVDDDEGRVALIRTEKKIKLTGDLLRDIEERGGAVRYDPARSAVLPWGSGGVRRGSNRDLAVFGRGAPIWNAPVVKRALAMLGGAVVAELLEV